jgi:hypothetical protein
VNPNPDKPKPKILVTESQRHKDFYFVILSQSLGAFVAKRKKFATKNTKFTAKELTLHKLHDENKNKIIIV